MNHYEAKLEAKRERLEERAEKARDEADSRFRASDMREEVSGIPFGQPILAGHHSERRHRRAIDKANRNARAGLEAAEKAKELERRAQGVGKGGVSSDDPEAVVKLKEKLIKMEKDREQYKKTNKLIRKKFMTAEKLAAEMGCKLEVATILLESDYTGRRVGIPSYMLTNLGANIRRVKARIEQLSKAAERPEAAPVEGDGYRIVESKEDNRVRFYFDERPDRETCKKMKQAGFRWSPTAGSWQRHLNNAGRYAAERMAKELFGG